MTDSAPDLGRLRIDRSTAPGRGGKAGWIVAVLIAVLAGLHGAWREGLLGDLGLDSRPVVRLGRVVRRGELVQRSGISANGYVVARRRAALSTDIQGRIVELKVEEGDRVEAGQLVARLDTRQLEANLAVARALQAQGRAALRKAEKDAQRLAALVLTGDASVSENDGAIAALDEARAYVDSLTARIAEIEVSIDKSSVYAPFAGVITAKDAEVGEVVAALGASGPNARGAVATLVDFDTLEVQIELAQSALAAARQGAAVTLYLDAYPDHAYPGRVRQIWPTANRTKATVEVRVEYLERDDRILPEMGVRAVFSDSSTAAVVVDEGVSVTVPEAAVLGPEGRRTVFMYDDGVARLAPIETGGDAVAGQVPVLSGLSGNEQVLLDPPNDLSDGAPVRLADEG